MSNMSLAQQRSSRFLTLAACVGIGAFIARKFQTKRKVIAVDMDEVLCQFVECINEWIKLNYNRPKSDEYVPLNEWIPIEVFKNNLKTENYVSYLFHETWKCTFQQATSIVQEFLDSSYFNNIENMKLVENSVKYLKLINNLIKEKYNNKIDLMIVTSRQSRIENITKKYIYTHFNDGDSDNNDNDKNNVKCIFKDIIFGNHFGLSGIKLSKPQICINIGACMLIDDSLKYCQQCAPILEKVLLFDWNNKYQWSKPIKYDPKKDIKHKNEQNTLLADNNNHGHNEKIHNIIGKHKLETLPLHPNITKVTSWQQVYTEIELFLQKSF